MRVTTQLVEGAMFVATDSNGRSVVADGGEENRGFKPAQLLLAALATCSGTDVVDILRKKRERFHGLQIEVDGTRQQSPPWTFRDIAVKYVVRGSSVKPEAVEQAIRLSMEKYCSVAATIKGMAKITTSYEIVQE